MSYTGRSFWLKAVVAGFLVETIIDLIGDGKVDEIGLIILLSHWKTQ